MTVKTTSPPTAPHPVPSFARRHPILTGFGILAGLSLFASYFPLSAIVTGGIVVVGATGIDRTALHVGRRMVLAVVRRWHQRSAAGAPPVQEGPAPAIAAHVQRPERQVRSPAGAHLPGAHRRPQPRARRAPRTPSPGHAVEDRELAGM